MKKRGLYNTLHITNDRRAYDSRYYRKNRKRILAQHRLARLTKGGVDAYSKRAGSPT